METVAVLLRDHENLRHGRYESGETGLDLHSPASRAVNGVVTFLLEVQATWKAESYRYNFAFLDNGHVSRDRTAALLSIDGCRCSPRISLLAETVARLIAF
jgi:hypothetical protein